MRYRRSAIQLDEAESRLELGHALPERTAEPLLCDPEAARYRLSGEVVEISAPVPDTSRVSFLGERI